MHHEQFQKKVMHDEEMSNNELSVEVDGENPRPHSPTGPPDFSFKMTPSFMKAPMPVKFSSMMNVPESPDNASQISNLIEELSIGETRLNALRYISVIASALGPARTRYELLPFLKDLIDDDFDYLCAMSKELLNLMDYVGDLSAILGAYELLCVREEREVRTLAVDSVKKVIERMDNMESAKDMVIRLGKSDWHSSRLSAVNLLPYVLKKTAGEHGKSLISSLLLFSKDESLAIRAAVAVSMKVAFLDCDIKSHCVEFVMALFRLVEDKQDIVRLRCVETIAKIPRSCFLVANLESNLVKHITDLSGDTSWRVRYILGANFPSFIELLADNALAIEIFSKLLVDEIPEIKGAAVLHFADVLAKLGTEVFAPMLPILVALSADSSPNTRESTAVVVTKLFSLLPTDVAVDKMLPLVLNLLKDENVDVQLVVLKHLASADGCFEKPAAMLFQAILPAMKSLAADASWRVRQRLLQLVTPLAKSLGEKLFESPVSELLMASLKDRVAEVRLTAAKICGELSGVYGPDFTVSKIIPSIQGIPNANSYLIKKIVLDSYIHISEEVPAVHCVCDLILNNILSFASDNIPNVRMRVCLALQALCKGNKCTRVDSVVSTLAKMRFDGDPDVKYLAEVTQECIEKERAMTH